MRIRPEETAKKTARWQAVALAACKQSGNPWLPEIARCAACRGAGRAVGSCRARPVSARCSRGPCRCRNSSAACARENCPRVALFIGPEGDFSAAEIAALHAAGVAPVPLGPVVLRVETAALFILSALQYAWS